MGKLRMFLEVLWDPGISDELNGGEGQDHPVQYALGVVSSGRKIFAK